MRVFTVSPLDGRGIADFDELIHKNIHRILRCCLVALRLDPRTLIEIAVSEGATEAGNCIPSATCNAMPMRALHCKLKSYRISHVVMQDHKKKTAEQVGKRECHKTHLLSFTTCLTTDDYVLQ